MDDRFHVEDVKKVAKGAVTTFVGTAFGKGLFFLSQLLMARLLGAEAFGLYVLGFVVVRISEVISRFGLNIGGMRFVSLHRDGDQSRLKGVLISATAISFASGTVMAVFLYLLSGWLALSFFNKPEMESILMIFAVSIPFLSGMTVVASLLQGFHTVKYTVYTRDIVQPVVNILLIASFYIAGWGLEGMVYAFILSHVAAFAAGCYYMNRQFPSIFRADPKPKFGIRSLLISSAPLLFLGFVQHFIAWTDTLMLGYFAKAGEVGVYYAAAQVPMVMTLFLASTNAIFGPLAAALHQKNEMQRLSSILKSTTRWIIYATTPIFILLIFSSREVTMLFGERYVERGHIVLIILSVGQLINCVTGGIGLTLIMTGKQRVQLINTLVIAGLNFGLNLVLIPRYGAAGAAVATSLAVGVISVLSVIEVYYFYGFTPYERSSLAILVPSGASVTLLFLVSVFLESSSPSFLNIAINAGCVSAVFLGFFYLIKPSAEDAFILSLFKRKLLGHIG